MKTNGNGKKIEIRSVERTMQEASMASSSRWKHSNGSAWKIILQFFKKQINHLGNWTNKKRANSSVGCRLQQPSVLDGCTCRTIDSLGSGWSGWCLQKQKSNPVTLETATCACVSVHRRFHEFAKATATDDDDDVSERERGREGEQTKTKIGSE